MKRLLDYSAVYSGFRTLIAGDRLNEVLVAEYIRPKRSVRILDIGCGPASILSALPEGVEYVGFDPSPGYIASAKATYRDRGTFFEGIATPDGLAGLGAFDIVLAVGVLHHLDQQQAGSFIELAAQACGTGGRFVTIDGCYRPGQSRMARILLSLDRGQYVRAESGYTSIAGLGFTNVKASLREDLLRIPYTHLILECQDPVPDSRL